MSVDNITKIKAELYDLQSHNCDGNLIVFPDGWEGHGCSGCARQMELYALLRSEMETLAEAAGGEE